MTAAVVFFTVECEVSGGAAVGKPNATATADRLIKRPKLSDGLAIAIPDPGAAAAAALGTGLNDAAAGAAAGAMPVTNYKIEGPEFVMEASKNVTILAGRDATFNCRIKNLGNWTVITH